MNKATILVVDDEMSICKSCEMILAGKGYAVKIATGGRQALDHIKEGGVDTVLLDLKMPEMDGMAVLEKIIEITPNVPVVMITAYASIETAVQAMKKGAFDYVPKPFTPDELAVVVEKAVRNRELLDENRYLKQELQSRYNFYNIIGSNSKMLQVHDQIRKVAPTNSTVIIYGESGTGKELVARATHFNSLRKDKQFMALDCSVLAETLFESELFGHIKGAFTGANTSKPGILEIVDGGTLFIDEIGDVSPAIQGKLLRVLQEREYKPVGDTTARKLDVRFIVATNKDLARRVHSGKFREDLYYRLNVVPIHLPPLRERCDDIPALAMHFIKKYSEEANRKAPKISAEVIRTLMEYDWPGNVRELANMMERLVVMTDERVVKPDHLPFHPKSVCSVLSGEIPATSSELKEAKRLARERINEEIEKAFVINALEKNDWNITRAARDVGMQRQNLQGLIRKYGINKPGR